MPRLSPFSRPDRLRIVGEEARSLVVLSGPIAFTQLGQISNGFIDVIMVGRLGAAELAGVALGNATYFMFMLMCLGTLHAVGPMVSQAFGAGAREPIARTLHQAFWLCICLAMPIVAILWFASPIWTILRQDTTTIILAQGYLRAAVWGFLPFLWFNALRNFVEAVSKPWPVTQIILGGIVLNIVANYGLMYGNFGLPRLGLAGTGWATSIVHLAMLLAIAVYIQSRRQFSTLRVFSGLSRFDFRYFRELVRIGLPIGGAYGLEVTLFSSTAFLVGTLGPVALAAHQIAIQCAAVAYMVPLGIGIATTVRVGQNVGRRSVVRATWSGFLGMGLSLVFMSGTAMIFLFAPQLLVSIYVPIDQPNTAATAVLAIELLGLAALFQLFDGLQVAAQGALRGLKDTRLPMLYCFFGYWLIGIPTGLILGYGLGWGATGFWWGLVTGLLAASLMLSLRFIKLTRTRYWRRRLGSREEFQDSAN
ncbi:MAG: MATE family efflux transporter [Bacteroidota bacterium]|nr:MATE family efflux transporter [Bacteroidota bacterium]